MSQSKALSRNFDRRNSWEPRSSKFRVSDVEFDVSKRDLRVGNVWCHGGHIKLVQGCVKLLTFSGQLKLAPQADNLVLTRKKKKDKSLSCA